MAKSLTHRVFAITLTGAIGTIRQRTRKRSNWVPTEQKNVDLLAAQEEKLREWLSNTAITSENLGELFAEDLRVLRNEIYARHGRVFKDAGLQKYFDSQAWYKANPEFKDDQLSEIEVGNLAIIKQAEESATSIFAAAEG